MTKRNTKPLRRRRNFNNHRYLLHKKLLGVRTRRWSLLHIICPD